MNTLSDLQIIQYGEKVDMNTLSDLQIIQYGEKVTKGIHVIGAGAGTGISAKFEEAGGVDLIVVYNSGRFRMAGRGSLAGLLPFADANAIVIEMANEVLPVVKVVPVLAGVCATDPYNSVNNEGTRMNQPPKNKDTISSSIQ